MFVKSVCLLLCVLYTVTADEFVQAVPCRNVESHCKNAVMKVSGCSSADERCPLYRGTKYTVEFFFEPTLAFPNKTDSRIYGVFQGLTVPYGKPSNPCMTSETVDDRAPCTPQTGFVPGRVYKYTQKFAVSNNFPTIQLKVRFHFYDRQYKTTLMCMEVPVEIQD